MLVELSNDEIRGILYAIEKSEAKELISKLNLCNNSVSKGLYSAEYKLRKLRTKLNKEEL
tara:strand:- start:11920 stop:12099 length:180 start_codon:yes stop_codon:yes gene_type:complete